VSTAAPLVAIIGPTASGKSALGLRVAEQLGGEVLACDSTQVYRHFDIGTAKPGAEERRRIAHHLLDLVEPHEVFTAGDYRRRAIAALGDLRARGALPVFTVGTGLYLRALLEGLADAPARSEELRARLRKRAEDRGAGYLHRLLRRLDALSAARIAATDTPKVIRAIEVCLESGRPMSEIHLQPRAGLEGFTPIRVGLQPPRAALYTRIDKRVESMLDAGWLDEVRRLLESGLDPAAKPFQFIGYSELRTHLLGVVGRAQAVKAIQQATRRYAKRQITWFRREHGVEWFAGFGEDPQIVGAVLQFLSEQIGRCRVSPAGAGTGV
jgi:tRNA dimethylallyltransferase